MGRIIDRLHSDLIPHDPAIEWSPCCVGCTIASRKLCEMFTWNRRRGTAIPYDPNYVQTKYGNIHLVRPLGRR